MSKKKDEPLLKWLLKIYLFVLGIGLALVTMMWFLVGAEQLAYPVWQLYFLVPLWLSLFYLGFIAFCAVMFCVSFGLVWLLVPSFRLGPRAPEEENLPTKEHYEMVAKVGEGIKERVDEMEKSCSFSEVLKMSRDDLVERASPIQTLYKCRACESIAITPDMKFCPMCGAKLEWEEGVDWY